MTDNIYSQIPAELKQLKQWCCFKLEADTSRKGKYKKMPKNPYTGGNAQSNNNETWSDYNTAVAAVSLYQFDGLGFFFDNGYFGVDIDGVEAEVDDFLHGSDNIISEFVHTLGSYSELSISKTGIHIICKGSLPKGGRRKKNVEMYQNGRFFIMTGNKIADYSDVVDCTKNIKALHEKYIGGGLEPTTGIISKPDMDLSENDIVKLISHSKQARTFEDLYSGNWDNYYTSQSDADMAFCNMLAFWTGRDYAKMNNIFRSSGLMREKWDRKTANTTYGAITLNKAIKDCIKTYEPKSEYSVSIGQKKPVYERFYSFDDTGNAERFYDKFAESVKFNYTNKGWMYYDTRRWRNDDTGMINRLCDEVVEAIKEEAHLYADDEDVEKTFLKHIKNSRSNRAKTSMVKELQHRAPILPNQLDTDSMAFNTPNGVLNLRNGELINHEPHLYISKISTTEYTETADCPEWTKFLDDIFAGDPELIRYIQKAIGYSLTGSTAEQCAFFCYGTGRNGKSTFLDAISEIIGDYATNIQPETLMIKQGQQGANSDIARLKGARFVTTVEPNEGVRLNEGLVKQLTGGDKVTARHLYGNEFEFTPEFKLWMGTNHKPIIRGTDIGIWRRIHLIPFTVQIPTGKVDRQLKYKLKAEYPAILKWMVDGSLMWQREGLELPKVIQQAVKEYQSEMDVIAGFIEDKMEISEESEESAANLYQSYICWAEENNQYKMSSTKFGTEFSKKFEKIKRKNGAYYIGIKFRRFSEDGTIAPFTVVRHG